MKAMSNLLSQPALWVIALLLVIVFRASHPLDEPSARMWMETKGYTEIKVVDTGEGCFKGKRKFKFLAENSSGNKSSGTLCFATVRAMSSVNEKLVANQAQYDRLAELFEN